MNGEKMFSTPSSQGAQEGGQEQEQDLKPVVSIEEGSNILKMNDLEAGGGGGLMLKKDRKEGFGGQYALRSEVVAAIMESGLEKAEINKLIKGLGEHSLKIIRQSDNGHSTVHAFTKGEKVGGGGIIRKKNESVGSLEVGAELVQIPEFEKRKRAAIIEARALSSEIQVDEAEAALELKPVLPPLTPPELDTNQNRTSNTLSPENAAENGQSNTVEKGEIDKKKEKLKNGRLKAIGAIALAAALSVGALLGLSKKGGETETEVPDFGSDAGIEVTQESTNDGLTGLAELDGSIFGAPTVEQDFVYDIGGTVDMPHVEAAPEAAPEAEVEAEVEEYSTPWNWAEAQSKPEGMDSMTFLEVLVSKAQEDGVDAKIVDSPDGKYKIVWIDGEDETTFVTNILGQYKW